MYQQAQKFHFKAISDELIFVPGRSKISNFRPDVQNQHFSLRRRDFVLKKSTITSILLKKTIKHKNIRFRGCFRCLQRRKNFRPLKHYVE